MRSSCAWSRPAALALWAVVLSATPVAVADDVDDIINDIIRQTRSRTEAGKKLMAAVDSLTDAPQIQTRLCEKAYEYGMMTQAGYPTALAALVKLEEIAPEKIETWRDKGLAVYNQQYYRGDRKSKFANGQAFINALQTRAGQCEKAEDWPAAAKHYRQAYGVARTLDLPNKKALFDRTLAAEHVLRTHARIAGLKRLLAKNPADASTRRQLVTMYLVDMDMPLEAAKYVGQGLDPVLARNVSLAAKDASELTDDDFAALGQWYKTLSGRAAGKEAKARLLVRGRDYLRMYLEVHEKQDVKRLSALNAMKGIDAALKALGVSSASPAAPKWLDMLALINPARHTVSGTWVRQGTGLVGSGKSHTRILVPVTAFGSYDLQLVFTVLSGSECTTVLPVGAGQATMTFGGWGGSISGLSNINGEDASDRGNPTRIDLGRGGKMLQVGVKTMLDVAVRIKDEQAHVTAKLNGKKVIDWTGMQSTLTLHRHWVMPIKAFGLGTAGSKVVWHTAKVRLLDPADRNIEWVSKDATFKISSTSSKYKPLKAFLTGEGELTSGCAIHTDYEATPWAIIALTKAVDVKRIVILNRQRAYSSRSQNPGLRVWTSVDGAEWQELWRAKASSSMWMINLKTPIKARYVKLGLVNVSESGKPRNSYLALAGVKIYAAPPAAAEK